jgi:hypothetical protein
MKFNDSAENKTLLFKLIKLGGVMEKLFRILFCVILGSILISCNGGENPTTNMDENNPFYERPDSGFLAKIDTVSDLRYLFNREKIQLTVPASVQLGRIGYGYEKSNEGNFYLSSRKEVYKFNEEGEYLRKLSRWGKGPGEYMGIFAIAIDMEENIYIIDGRKKSIHIYDEKFKFIDDIELETVFSVSDAEIEGNVLYTYVPLGNEDIIYQYDISKKKFIKSYGVVDSLYRKYRSNLAFGSLEVRNGYVVYMHVHSPNIHIYDKQLKHTELEPDLEKFIPIKKKKKNAFAKLTYSIIFRFDILKNILILQTEHPNREYPLKGTSFDIVDFNGNVLREQLLFSGVLNIKRVTDNALMSVKYPSESEVKDPSNPPNPEILLFTLKEEG